MPRTKGNSTARSASTSAAVNPHTHTSQDLTVTALRGRAGDIDNLPPPEEKVWGGGYFKPGEQWRDYHVTEDGEIYAGYLNCGTTLVDVPEGSGFVRGRPRP